LVAARGFRSRNWHFSELAERLTVTSLEVGFGRKKFVIREIKASKPASSGLKKTLDFSCRDGQVGCRGKWLWIVLVFQIRERQAFEIG